MEIKYPEIEITLLGEDGNAFAILGAVQRELRQNGIEDKEIALFVKEATSGNYDELLQTCMKWVTVV